MPASAPWPVTAKLPAVSTRVNQKTVPSQSGLGLPPKSERRALGKAAAAKRAKAKRRSKQLRTAGAVLLALIPVALVVAAIGGAFSSDDKTTAGSANPSAAATASGAPAAPQVSLDPALAAKPTVTKGTGDLTQLKVETLVKGTGPAVQAGQNITVNYVGVGYKDGKEFDSSWSRNEPATFPIGNGSVIEGWDKGLVGVTVGSRVQLDIPAAQAYGENPANGPAGPLRFVVDIISAS
jgi:peptidylprolyl isomerase